MLSNIILEISTTTKQNGWYSHLGTHLGLEVVGVLVLVPGGGVVGVGHRVGGDVALPVALPARHQAGHQRRRAEVELQPLMV